MSKQNKELVRDIKRRWAIKCDAGELFCFLCGNQIKRMKDCSADHWIPKALGGKDTEENLKPSHKQCNTLKGCIPPNEFMQYRDIILSGQYKQKKQEIQLKKIPKDRSNLYGLGEVIYYIKQLSNDPSAKIEVKKGIILGYAEDGCVLVKNFYSDKQGIIQSELIEVIPLSKSNAMHLKYQYNEAIKILQLQLNTQLQRYH